MEKLLKLEYRKLKRQKSFYICTGIMVALLFFSALTGSVLLNAAPELVKQFDGSGINSLLSAVKGSSFGLIISIFTVLFVCDDYDQQTVKTIYARGYSRKSLYLAKMISVWTAATIMFVIIELAGFAFGSMYFGIGNMGNYKFIALVGAQYVITMANVSLYYAIASVLRKNGSSIAACIVVPMVVDVVLALADSVLGFEDFSLTSLWVSNFLADVSVLTVSAERLLVCVVASLVYIFAFLAVGVHFNKKIEL